jgi:DNA-binding CsgD family transcriptional regulator
MMPLNYGNDFLTSYGEYYYAKDVWAIAADERQYGTGSVVLGEELADPDALKASEIYADIIRPKDVPHLMSGVAEKSAQRIVHLSLFRRHCQEQFGEPEIAAFRALLPSIRTATRSILQLRGLQAQAQALSEALMRSGQPIVLLDGIGEIVESNDIAATLLHASTVLSCQGRRLVATRPEQTAAIKALAYSAATPGAAADPVVVCDATQPEVYALTAVPLRGADRAHRTPVERGIPAVAIFIATPKALAPATATTLTRAYGLTPAQARVSQFLACGLTLADVACRLNVSYETARCHLKMSLAKTGTSNQAQLVKTVLGLRTPAEPSRTKRAAP